MSQAKIHDTMPTTEWFSQFQVFIYQTLAPIIPNEQRRIKYVEQEPMMTWLQAFTHETVDPDFNYEELELLGDRILEAVFADYMSQRFPKLKKGTLSELKTAYMSKLYQQKLATQLGFGQWIRVRDTTVETNILEDVFESFFGALFRISDQVDQRGKGYLNCYNYIVVLFNEIEIDFSVTLGKSKTQIKQMFEKMAWGTPIEQETYKGEDGSVVTVSATPTAINAMRCHNVTLPTVLGQGSGKTKTGAAANAYDEALKTLFALGITHEWVQQEKEERELSDPGLSQLVAPARQRLQREGFARMRFCYPRTAVSARNATVQLIGTTPEGRETVLASTVVSVKEMNEGKRIVLQQYLDG